MVSDSFFLSKQKLKCIKDQYITKVLINIPTSFRPKFRPKMCTVFSKTNAYRMHANLTCPISFQQSDLAVSSVCVSEQKTFLICEQRNQDIKNAHLKPSNIAQAGKRKLN